MPLTSTGATPKTGETFVPGAEHPENRSALTLGWIIFLSKGGRSGCARVQCRCQGARNNVGRRAGRRRCCGEVGDRRSKQAGQIGGGRKEGHADCSIFDVRGAVRWGVLNTRSRAVVWPTQVDYRPVRRALRAPFGVLTKEEDTCRFFDDCQRHSEVLEER